MDDYTWSTEQPHSNNTETMNDFLENYMISHCGVDFHVMVQDGSYAEIGSVENGLYAVHASGNGDFCNHRVRFELLF